MQAAMKQRTTDLSAMYVLTDPRHERAMGPGLPTLDDLADVALRALNATIALIVLDGTGPRQPFRRAGVAAIDGVAEQTLTGNAVLARLVDPVFAEEQGYAFYAATPLRDDYGVRVGTLAVLGDACRTVSDEDLATFRTLARIVERFI